MTKPLPNRCGSFGGKHTECLKNVQTANDHRASKDSLSEDLLKLKTKLLFKQTEVSGGGRTGSGRKLVDGVWMDGFFGACVGISFPTTALKDRLIGG